MLKWCHDAQNRNKDGAVIHCYNWVCTCGSIANYHLLYDKEEIKQFKSKEICSENPNCKGFVFANNNNCTLECQMLYLVNKSNG